MVDLAQIAQSGVDPISGSYLSAERRKAIFAKSRNISSNIFRRGGPLVAINRQPDDGALALVQNQSQIITSLREEVNSLRTQVVNFDNVIRIQTQTIGGVQEQVGNVGNNIKQLSGSLDGITRAISTDSILEQNRTKQEQEEQRRATEQGLRIGRESLLEKVMQAALIAPVQKIAQKAQSILSKVAQFFTTLFIGWFTNQGIKTLKALTDGNGKKLEEIRDNVLKGLGIAAGTLFLLNGGFFAIAGTITRLSLKIGGWLVKNTIGRFFGALGNLLKSAGNAIVSTGKAGVALLTGGGAKAATAGGAAAAGGVVDDAAKAAARGGGGLLKSAGNLFKGATSLGSKLFAPLNIGISAYRFSQGDVPGGFLSAAAAVPGLGLPAVGVDIARELNPNLFKGTFLEKKENKKEPPKAAVTPQTPVVPNNKAPNAPTADNGQSFNQTMDDLTSQASKIDWEKPAQFGEFSMMPDQGTSAQVSSQSTQANIKTPAQTTRLATLPLNVGPTPEPTPSIIYKRVGSSAQQRSGAAPTGGPVNEVPAISASNPDNFYVLYSQVNYNVVT
jgi:hypothetical protein